MNYFISDICFRIRYKLTDHFLKGIWKFRLGSLGRDSFIRSETRIIGNPRRIRIGNKFKIYENCIIAIGKGEILIGNDGLIGVGTYINCGNEKLIIGNGVAIAPFCKIFTFSHHYNSYDGIINSYKTGDVIIEDDVLIGTNTVILPGVRIGKSSIIAANSLVNKDITPFSIIGGSPAKLIKMRNSESSDIM
jgi:acetyltransferase-like isoleucine patch superfamily enzyme